MGRLCLFAIYDPKTKRPRCVGIKAGDQYVHKELFRPGSGRSIYAIDTAKREIRDLILAANQKHDIITSGFKELIETFDLPLLRERYRVFDLHLPIIPPTESQQADIMALRHILNAMMKVDVKQYQRIMANAAVVYHDLEKNGIRSEYTPLYPKWSQRTFSGRSKTLGFNLQGATDAVLRTLGSADTDVLIHFDWISADIRVAAILAQDAKLFKAFESSDPYTVMMKQINDNASDEKRLTRDECKTYLLESINSMDVDNIALHQVFPALGSWIKRCRATLQSENGCLSTLLGRRFCRRSAKNELAVLNGVMQGSVAHAMQTTIRRIWEVDIRLLAEIHDSLVVESPCDSQAIRHTVDTVVSIMMYPFEGLLDSNPAFPVKVSIGRKWHKWKWLETHRHDFVEKLGGQKAIRDKTP